MSLSRAILGLACAFALTSPVAAIALDKRDECPPSSGKIMVSASGRWQYLDQGHSDGLFRTTINANQAAHFNLKFSDASCTGLFDIICDNCVGEYTHLGGTFLEPTAGEWYSTSDTTSVSITQVNRVIGTTPTTGASAYDAHLPALSTIWSWVRPYPTISATIWFYAHWPLSNGTMYTGTLASMTSVEDSTPGLPITLQATVPSFLYPKTFILVVG